MTKAESALAAIPTPRAYDSWLTISMAFKAAGGSYEFWDNWSRRGDGYDARNNQSAWNSINPVGGVTEATLYYQARQHAWKWTEADSWNAAPRRIGREANPPACRAPRRTREELTLEAIKSNSDALQSRIISAGGGELDPFGADVWEASPIRIDTPIGGDMLLLLEHLYQPDDMLFIGRKEDSGVGHVKPVAKWLELFRARAANLEFYRPIISPDYSKPGDQVQECLCNFLFSEERYPLIMPNPLTGEKGMAQNGRPTLRGDACVKSFRYIVAESDNLPLPKQGGILRGLCRPPVDFRLAALIYSGGKSCHAWLKCDGITCLEDWRRIVQRQIFPYLGALGFDTNCSNPARLSRLPGIFRKDKRKWQRLLYLAPEGGIL